MKGALILKNLSDRLISVEKKLIDYIINWIDRSYGKISDFKYKIDEQNVFFNSGFNFHFMNQSFLGLVLKILPNSSYKSNSTDKKIAQYNSSYSSPMLQLRVSNITFNFGMSFWSIS